MNSAARNDGGVARAPFLFEIGTDDLPARFIPVSVAHVESAAAALFDELGLAYESLLVTATPRRLALMVEGLAISQTDREVEMKGPPVAVAFDAAGEPTAAAHGFARENGIDLADSYHVTDAKGGEFLAVRKVIVGRTAADLLAERVPALVLGIPFPKKMRWGTLDLEYARPIQWLVALLGGRIVPVAMAGIEAGRVTRGHRTLADDREITIPDPEEYVGLLRDNSVVVLRDERRAMIESGAAAAIESLAGAEWRRDEELLEEVVDLCEYPTPFVGAYDPDFFELPPEVIVTALKVHKRYFAVDKAGSPDLMPCFLAVRDGGEDHLDNVRAGNEKVLRARLSDALFYWNFDQRLDPDGHAARLDDVTWIEGYGSVGDKVRRLAGLAAWLWDNGRGDGGAVPPALVRAAGICKFDLVCEMIRDGKEFTKLEGMIGARYAARAGEDPEVCSAIEGHYLPRSAGGGLPADRISKVLSLADRYDNLAGCWLAGFSPTGAKDPYALRRHALALIRIEMDLGRGKGMAAALDQALAGFRDAAGKTDPASAALELQAFVQRRLAGHLEGSGCELEVVRAVLPSHGDDPADALAWAQALAGFKDQPDFLLLATGFKRCKNILEGHFLPAEGLADCRDRWAAGGSTPDGKPLSDLPDAAEKSLCAAVVAAAPVISGAEADSDYSRVFGVLSALGPAIDDFFDSVRVNVADQELKSLRHDFLREIHGLFVRYADFSAVAPSDGG